MLETLRERYASEFANIPERYRPKAKAYVARAAYYKPEGPARNAYIQEWLKKDREAAEVRMGQRAKPSRRTTTLAAFEDEEEDKNVLADTFEDVEAPTAVPATEARGSPARLSIAQTRKMKFTPSADPLRAQAGKAAAQLEGAVVRLEKRLTAKARTPEGRAAAREFAKETRRVARELAKETRRQAAELERAARLKLRQEAQKALDEIRSQAARNLEAVTGYRARKNHTRRLAHLRDYGAQISAKTFLEKEQERGRWKPRKTRKGVAFANMVTVPSTTLPSNVAIPMNSYND